MSYISLRGIEKRIGFKKILKGINLSISKNKVFGIVGLNGAGKTTLLNLLAGINKPSSGYILVANKRIKGYFGRFGLREQIAYVSQKDLDLDITLKDFLLEQSILRNIDVDIDAIITQNNLDHLVHKPLSKLSHGYQRFVNLLQAFMGREKILLLDEPFAGLDALNKRKLRNLIKINRRKRTIILTSHILEELKDILDDIAVIHNGVIRFEGSIKDIKNETNEYLIRVEKITKKALDSLSGLGDVVQEGKNVRILARKEISDEIMAILVKNKIRVNGFEREIKIEDFFFEKIKA
jgi:ABC-2 type transport system ATP-binding protein